MKKILISILFILLLGCSSYDITITRPDGTVIHCNVHGADAPNMTEACKKLSGTP